MTLCAPCKTPLQKSGSNFFLGANSLGVHMTNILGIDLGTSNSVITVIEAGRPTVVANEWGETIHSSCVAFLPGGSVLVGNEARKGLAQRPERTVVSIKRLIGRTSASEEVSVARSRMGYEIIDADHEVRLMIDGRSYRLEEISALILRELKTLAETYLDGECSDAVITVPAYFDDNQRQATRNAAEIAGINVRRVLNEPTAAALAYGYGEMKPQRVAVYDLGGGTFDISILEMGAGVLEVLATSGDTFLGGDDVDAMIADVLADFVIENTQRDPRKDPAARMRLNDIAERTKCWLSDRAQVEVDLEPIAGLPLRTTITRRFFEHMLAPFVQKSLTICAGALADAQLAVHQVDGVVLVGGSTRIPAVREAVIEFFRRQPDDSIDPDIVVSVGAALYAKTLSSTERASQILLDVTPLSLRLGTVGGFSEMIIERNAPIPTERTRLFATSQDNQTEVAIRVYQGEEERSIDNVLLGEFVFGPLPPKPRGDVEISVTFEIDPNGLVRVTAKDTATGVGATASVRLSVQMNAAGVAEAQAALPSLADENKKTKKKKRR
jgi:molecular chaperone DnaK